MSGRFFSSDDDDAARGSNAIRPAPRRVWRSDYGRLAKIPHEAVPRALHAGAIDTPQQARTPEVDADSRGTSYARASF